MIFLTPQEVAEILNINYQTVLKYIKEGKLKAMSLNKGYRIKEEDLDKFIEENSNI